MLGIEDSVGFTMYCRSQTPPDTTMDTLEGTPQQLFLVALYDEVVGLRSEVTSLRSEVAGLRGTLTDLRSKVAKGPDRQKLVAELHSRETVPQALTEALDGTWVKELLLAISDPHNRTIMLYGPGGTGKTYWSSLINMMTSVVASASLEIDRVLHEMVTPGSPEL